MADNLVAQLSTLSVNLSAESGAIGDAAQKKLNDAIVVLQQVARKYGADIPSFLTAFDTFLAENIDKYVQLSEELGGEVAEQAKLVKECFVLERDVIAKAATIKRPGPKDIGNFFKALNAKVLAIVEFAEKRRQSKVFNQLMTIKEGIGCIGWVTVEPKPGPYVKEMLDQAMFYANRVIKDNKGVNDKYVVWVRCFADCIKSLNVYVLDYNPTGIQWNVQSALAPTSTPAAAGEASEFLSAFDDFISASLNPYVKLSVELGGDIATHADKVKQTFLKERQVLEVAVNSRQPGPTAMSGVMKPLSDKVTAVTEFCEANRSSKAFNQLMTVKEGIGCVGWVTVFPKPVKYVEECYDQALFYGNRVLKDYKGKDEKQVAWMRSYMKLIKDLKEYVATYHVTGLNWNPKGKEASPPSGGVAAPGPPGAGPPPPPPPPAVEAPTGAPTGGANADRSAKAALFSDINKGGAVTSGLKKVTPDMQTHKNPQLRQGGQPVAAKAGAATVKAAPKAAAAAKVMKPRLELLYQKKWSVEYQKNNKDIVIEGEMKQAVYAFKCENSTIRINNKISTITLDSCKKTALVFDQCLGSVDLINCQSVQIQVINKVPIVSIDKTDGAMIYLSSESLDTIVMSAKSSEMNLLVPKGDGEFEEFPLPEQYKTSYDVDGKKFVTECNESLG